MGFSTDYTDVNDFDLIPTGEYEVIIKKIEERTTQNGATGLNLTLIIRNDTEQKYQNRCIFHTLWKRKEPTQADMQVQGYSFKQIMQLAKAAKLPSGKSYETVNDLCADLIDHVMRVTIGHDEYNGQKREIVKFMNESRFPECKHVYKEKPAVTADTVAQRPQEQFADATANISSLDDFIEVLSDDDVPF
ncbi:MAG: DUF669 domain-containing protein [Oscillospiraceae bacterium]|nr:DUF669 domain-containing protein [Oscillospiraceae bacterium]